MTVEFAKEPAGSRDALRIGLQTLGTSPTPAAQGHLAAAANAEAPPPLPVYVLELKDLTVGILPNNPSPVAWEFLLVSGGQAVRTAEVYPDRANPQKFAFGSISTAVAAGAAQALTTAESDARLQAGRYEMRLLRVPALYVLALWLKDLNVGGDFYVVIPPAPDGLATHVIIAAPDFIAHLRSMAALKTQASPLPRGISESN